LLQQVLGDPLLALARPGGACDSRETHVPAPLMVLRPKLSDSARDQLNGATLERDAQEVRGLRCRILGRRARRLCPKFFIDPVSFQILATSL
jgi:hypothetical protein